MITFQSISLSRLPVALRFLLPAMILGAFLTETKFIPSIANNVGFFEVLGLIIIALFFFVYREHQLRWNPEVRIIGLLLVVALISQINLPASHTVPGLIATSILLFLFLFLLAIYNICVRFQVSPGFILGAITVSTLIVGPWVLLAAVRFEGTIEMVGPFRNRAHMASYMLTAFWLVVIAHFWPSRFRFKRPISYAAMVLCLYAVAVSGRRSVYLSLFIGLAALAVAFLVTGRGKRINVLIAGLFAVGFLLGFYYLGSRLLPRGDFFRERVGMIGSHLSAAVKPESNVGKESFFALQRQGVRHATRDHPFVGIGWGGFAKSDYSPTGHEVHSTPLRFLAETGVIGLGAYLLLLGLLLGRSARLALRLRKTAYGPAYLAMSIALWSLSVSWLYNRHITERTFWLLLITFTLFEPFARTIEYRLAQARRRVTTPAPPVAGPQPLPAEGQLALPLARLDRPPR